MMQQRSRRQLQSRVARYASVLTRQRGFAARFRGVRRSAQDIRALAGVLRRLFLVMHQHGAPLHVALHAVLRGTGPALAPGALPPAPGRTRLVRQLVTREHGHVPRSLLRTNGVDRAIAVHPQAPAPAARRVMLHRIERQPGFPPLALTMVRSFTTAAAAAAAIPGGPAPSSAPRRAACAPDAARGAVAAPLVLPQPELARVTEHVIRQLDRRVLSYRERTGQV